MALESTNLDLDALLPPGRVAQTLGVTTKTLEAWRSKGSGPVYLKLGPKGSVRYRAQDLANWLDSNTHVPPATAISRRSVPR